MALHPAGGARRWIIPPAAIRPRSLQDYFGSNSGSHPCTSVTVPTLTRLTWPTTRMMYSLFVGAVGIGRDAAAFVGGDLSLVDDPFQGTAVAKAVVERFGRDCGEGQRRRLNFPA